MLTVPQANTQFEGKMTKKVSHNRWLARKLFHRSPSTFSLEVKASEKPISRKMSLANIPKLGDGERNSLFEEESLEEMTRLGGMGFFSLPHEFGRYRTGLVTCLVTLADELFEKGKLMLLPFSFVIVTEC